MIKVYTYGSRPPTQGQKVLWSQLRLAHDFYNELVSIERTRRAEYVAARLQHCPEVAALEAEVAVLDQQLEAVDKASKEERKLVRNRKRQPERSAQSKAIRAIRKPKYELLKAAKLAAREHPALIAAAAVAEAKANDAIKHLRATGGVYWPTYNLVTDSVTQAAKKSGALGPRFKKWEAEGRVGGQIQGGVPMSKVFEQSDTHFRLTPLPETQWATKSGRRHAYAVASIRIQSNAKGEPIWCDLPIVMHRPLPADGIVRYAWVLVRRLGLRTKYVVQVVVESASHGAVRQGTGGALAVDVGWRALPDGSVRVAYCLDETGQVEEIRVPEGIMGRLRHADDLRGVSDRQFDRAKTMAISLKGANRLPKEVVTGRGDRQKTRTLDDILAHLYQVRSHSRLVTLVRWLGDVVLGDDVRCELWQRWRRYALERKLDLLPELADAQALSGLSEVQAKVWWLDLWRRKDGHLKQWEADVRRHALAHRREIFRVAAARLAGKYSSLVIEDLNLAALVAVPPPTEHDDGGKEQARKNHQAAAPGECRSALVAAFGEARVARHPAADTTRLCHQCKQLCQWDQEHELCHRCEHEGCGAEWDQDENACRNLHRLERETPGGKPKPAPARKRVRRKKTAAEPQQEVIDDEAAE
jgi:hypothetical protein